MISLRIFFPVVVTLLASLLSGCSKSADHAGHAQNEPVHKHEHHAPHDGTAVELGEEIYHLEFVLDPAAGKLSAYVLDGEMENYIRCAMPSFEVVATVDGQPHPLTFNAIADPASGEKIGDTSLFEATADWLKTTRSFDAVLTKLDVRGNTFTAVAFNFPKGNDHDDAKTK